MKRKHTKTLSLIFSRPVSGNIKWRDIESLFVELGGEINEAEGSRVCVRLFGDRRYFIGRTLPQMQIKGLLVAYVDGWR